jgi:hypothetical protein
MITGARLLLSYSLLDHIYELLDFSVGGFARHEARDRLTVGEAANEGCPAGDRRRNDLAEST